MRWNLVAGSSKAILPHTAFPEKKPTPTPARMAASMRRYISRDQYSSCPTLRKPFARVGSAVPVCVSVLET